MMRWLSLYGLALYLLGVGIPGSASATTLLGDVISGSYDYPCVGCTNVGGFWYTTSPFVVDGTVETSLQIGTNPTYYSKWDVSFGADSVTLTMAPAPFSSVSYSPDPFNGPVFTVLSGNSFGSVTGIYPNLHCTPCSPVTAFISGEDLFINWQGAGGNVGDTIEVDFTVGSPIAAAVPEAPTLPLFATGLGLMALLAWRRRLPPSSLSQFQRFCCQSSGPQHREAFPVTLSF
jgi:hypothetical protein